ncbi:hypothetical protein [Marinicellulosiphila megalodicopiae]
MNSWFLRISAFTAISLLAVSANTDSGESTMMFSNKVAVATQ